MFSQMLNLDTFVYYRSTEKCRVLVVYAMMLPPFFAVGFLERPPVEGESAWRPEWEALLKDRARMSCNQAGPRGPPWTDVPVRGFLSRWLPWHWYSLGGTGWCYDEHVDELDRCDTLAEQPSITIDWNGIARRTADSVGFSSWRFSFCYLCVIAFVLHCAYRSWAKRQREWLGEGLDVSKQKQPTFSRWVQTRQVLPWLWSSEMRWVLASSILGVCVAFSLPLGWIKGGHSAALSASSRPS